MIEGNSEILLKYASLNKIQGKEEDLKNLLEARKKSFNLINVLSR